MAMLSEMMNWRYSTKVFDKTKKIDEKTFDEIMESLRMAPSSYGLQPWKFLVIRDENIRAKLRPFSWNQGQITDASHLIVFCANTKIDADYVEKYIDLVAKTRNIDKEKIGAYKDMMIKML
ncbi:nitroreductase family protein [Candidatus Deianiraea vastatrix]|uniref:Nitroreductase n=1 Tax=Candidatus Deianiraea vastatrix TaxID=2163644 RepID=A0A5B8XF04_9RICK|nr:nitroreductase family protein [Candidatus Deianiraea vastatrix]QED23485.1 Putative nitroreductase [Candidatus Deianiraea vastatrix]